MKGRVAEALGKGETRGLIVSTFHNLGLRILGKEHKRLGYKTGFSIFDASDTLTLLKGLHAQESVSNVDDAEEVRWRISRWPEKSCGARMHASPRRSRYRRSCPIVQALQEVRNQ